MRSQEYTGHAIATPSGLVPHRRAYRYRTSPRGRMQPAPSRTRWRALPTAGPACNYPRSSLLPSRLPPSRSVIRARATVTLPTPTSTVAARSRMHISVTAAGCCTNLSLPMLQNRRTQRDLADGWRAPPQGSSWQVPLCIRSHSVAWCFTGSVRLQVGSARTAAFLYTAYGKYADDAYESTCIRRQAATAETLLPSVQHRPGQHCGHP
ncbi:hypothetical protein OH77DRAFT_123634 [Trametes cingulata]|nr:hypothetical protein OH77DRAFT_123634 [Trametes cingulata]